MTPEQEAYLLSAEKGDRFDLSKEELTIGRNADNDLHFAFPEVSSKHAVLKRTESGWLLVDLGSTNGTFINGAKLKGEGPIKNGDTLKFGRKVYAFHCPSAAEAKPEEEKTVLFESKSVSEKTVVFDSQAAGAGAVKKKKPLDKMSVSDFRQAFGKEEKKPQAAAAAPPAGAGPDHKTKAGARPAPAAPPPGGELAEMPTMMAMSAQMGDQAYGMKVFGALTEKTLSSKKKVFSLTSLENNIGSTPDNNVVIDHDETIARHHATIIFESPTRIMARLRDNNAILKINGKFYKNHPLKDNDTVELGDLAFIFNIKEAPVFRVRKSIFAKKKKLLIVAAALILVFGVLAVLFKDEPAPDTPSGDAPPILVSSLTEINTLWQMIERTSYTDALAAVEKYRRHEQETAESSEQYQAPAIIDDIAKTIEILQRCDELRNNQDYYLALQALEELPQGAARNLKISQDYFESTADYIETKAGETYRAGVTRFDQGSFEQAQTSFDQTLAVHPEYRDARLYLQRVEVALHYNDFLTKVKESLRAKQITQALEQIDGLEAYDGLGLPPLAAEDVQAFETERNTLQQHIQVYLMYEAGQGQEALDAFATIPETYSGYQDLRILSEQIDETMKAYAKALSTSNKQDFDTVMEIEPQTSNFYHQDAARRKQTIIDQSIARAKQLIEEGRALQIQGGANRYEALKKYYQAFQAEPDYLQAESMCLDLARELSFEIYQMEDAKKAEKRLLYTTIIDNTPPNSKPHTDARRQRELLR